MANKWELLEVFNKSYITEKEGGQKLTNVAKEYNKNIKQTSYAQALTNGIHAYII